ncbi:MAG: selenium-dependent molybdenum cofactor biosynthesis protein YqeB [Candidatus Ventricola sp.]
MPGVIDNLIIVRGGGDLATGTIDKLHRCGFPVLILETENPSAIRRNVAFSEAVYQGRQTVEGVTCHLAGSAEQAEEFLREGKLTLMIDPAGECIPRFHPLAVVDAILAKENLGTCRSMAPITVALGPGFAAGTDVDAVVETKRGHNLGRVFYDGTAAPNTGVPGVIGGYGKERVIHSPAAGILRCTARITDIVVRGQTIAMVETADGQVPVQATLTGLLRGLLRDSYPVTRGLKIADIDPRVEEYDNCFTISDKARCIAGGVLEAILHLLKEKNT